MAREEVARNNRRSDGCVQYETLLQELVLDILPRRKRSFVAAHLRECGACREYLRQARRMPALLASLPTPEPPADLVEQIKGACLVASLVSRHQVPGALWARMSYASAAAAALLVFTALSYLPIAARTAHHELAATMLREPAVTIPGFGNEPVSPGRLARPAAGPSQPRPVVFLRSAVSRPVALPAQRRWYASAPRPVEQSGHMTATVLRATSPRSATSRKETGTVAARGRTVTSPSTPNATATVPPSTDTSIDGVNNRVAHGVAAGVLAGALIEHYLADAIARRGTDLAAAGLATPPTPTETPSGRVPSDAVPAAM